MSYEGYYQFLCKNGHRWAVDAYSGDEKTEKCPDCGGKVYWWNLVDLTNCCEMEECAYDDIAPEEQEECRGHGLGYIKLKQNPDKNGDFCETCRHRVVPATYKIPQGRGHLIVERKE